MPAVLLASLAVCAADSEKPAGASAAVGRAQGVDPGKRIYREGVLLSGEPVRALVQAGDELSGARAACATCHGRSGLGYAEGQIIPPAISGPILFRPRVIERRELYAARREGPGTRPAYTEETLARAIREGVDARGTQLDPPMPRYLLGDGDMAALVSYLRALGAAASPGVSDEEIHLATVVTAGVPPARRKAMLEVLSAFVEAKNTQTRHEERRARSRGALQVEREQRAYRRWTLDVWELTGAPETWRTQLEAHYAVRPVFALLSGAGAGSWAPVHEFCGEMALPCILPNTDLPGQGSDPFYTLYFSPGLPLEARVLARYLRDSGETAAGTWLQVYRDEEVARAAAAALRSALGGVAARLRDVRLEGPPPSADFWRETLRREVPAVLVLWLADPDLGGLEGLASSPPSRISAVYLSATLVEKPFSSLPQALRPLARLVHPFGLPEVQQSRLDPTRSWLRSRGVEITDLRTQANTYFAARALGEALMHLAGNFSRDYLMEKLEHRLASAPWASVYSTVGLGSGQRFLSKGAYVVCLEEKPHARLVAVSDWIIP
jgi:mono/diheme cytochrome c family protein